MHHENQHHSEQCWPQLHRNNVLHILDQWVKISSGGHGVNWLWPHITVVASWTSGKMETWFYPPVSLLPSIHSLDQLKAQDFWSWHQRRGTKVELRMGRTPWPNYCTVLFLQSSFHPIALCPAFTISRDSGQAHGADALRWPMRRFRSMTSVLLACLIAGPSCH